MGPLIRGCAGWIYGRESGAPSIPDGAHRSTWDTHPRTRHCVVWWAPGEPRTVHSESGIWAGIEVWGPWWLAFVKGQRSLENSAGRLQGIVQRTTAHNAQITVQFHSNSHTHFA